MEKTIAPVSVQSGERKLLLHRLKGAELCGDWLLVHDGEEHTAGAKAHVDIQVFSARLKSCPFKTFFI